MIQTGVSDSANMILFLSLGHLILEFVQDFDIRISNFANGVYTNHASGLRPRPAPLDRIFT